MDLGFEPLREGDLPLLASWLARPHVERWWREPTDLACVQARYRPLVEGTDPTEGLVVMLDARPIGFVQRYRLLSDPEWLAVLPSALNQASGFGLDYLIGDATLVGRGIGRRMIATVVARSWARYPDDQWCVVALQQDNIASWKALEACGFERDWSGQLPSSHPSDRGPSFIYRLGRPGAGSGDGAADRARPGP